MSESNNEKIIVQGCLQNNRQAQKALYEKYKTEMYTLAYRITNNFEDANDALQEGFLQVFENLKTFKGNSKLGTWIHTIVARAAIKKIKNKIHFVEINDSITNNIIDWSMLTDVRYLEEAIASLPAGYRTVFTLYEIEGFKHKEIAEILNISVSTSKTQLFKAKRLLMEHLKNTID